ncbi:hypothetical protein EW145_g2061 [Phellinidium pouzarii]|uniref:Uncharacterized protein n=1 Tax=Phellinidium pouzarii TaxID=167371 RepID=A0A4S4LDY0_9AGAM|nr:hypothetical protein EW145_g2061 [Phellinidium pouzarii]
MTDSQDSPNGRLKGGYREDCMSLWPSIVSGPKDVARKIWQATFLNLSNQDVMKSEETRRTQIQLSIVIIASQLIAM